jgi:hypothetical protein
LEKREKNLKFSVKSKDSPYTGFPSNVPYLFFLLTQIVISLACLHIPRLLSKKLRMCFTVVPVLWHDKYTEFYLREHDAEQSVESEF